MYSLTVSHHFMAAHSLVGQVFGPAQRLHGATYVVEAELRRETLDADGIICDIGLALDLLQGVIAEFDMRNLDEFDRIPRTKHNDRISRWRDPSAAVAADQRGSGRVGRHCQPEGRGAGNPDGLGRLRCAAWMTGLAFVVPGRLDQLTGGYLYDRHIIDGLRDRGREVEVIELGSGADGRTLASIADGTPTVVDGLALPGLEQAIPGQARAACGLSPWCTTRSTEETGLSRREAERLSPWRLHCCRGFAACFAQAAEPPRRSSDMASLRSGSPLSRRVRQSRRSATAPSPAGALLCVASLIPRKGHRVLIEALRRLGALDWSLLCVGALDRDPPTTRTVRRMISAAGLDRRITLAGEWPPERVTDAYRAADIFVLPSFHEGYGMAYAEAMAHGLPIIAHHRRGHTRNRPRQAGLLVSAR